MLKQLELEIGLGSLLPPTQAAWNTAMGKAIILWLLGVPVVVIVILAITHVI
jgi:hypothetical protein